MRNLLTCGTGYVAAGWLAAACMCLAAGQPGAVAAGPATAPAPKLICYRIFEFPDTWQGETVEHDFVVSNEGDGPLELLEVKSSDGNTQLKYDKVIAPGAAGKVSATLRIPRERGGPSKQRAGFSILVTTNDPKQPKIVLTLQGRVKPFIGVDPRDIKFGNLSAGEESTRTVRVTNYTDTPMKLKLIPPPGQEKYFTVDIKEIEPGKVAEVTVTARKPPYMPGRTHFTRLDFTTGIEKAKLTSISTTVTVGVPGQAASKPAGTGSLREFADVKAKGGQAATQPGEPSEWIETLSSHLHWPPDKISITRQEDGTCVYDLSFRDIPISDWDWREMCLFKSPGAPLVVHGPPESVSAAGPAVRFIVHQRAVWPASQQHGPHGKFQPAATGEPNGAESAAVPPSGELPYLKNFKMPPNRGLWVEMDLVTDGGTLSLDRLQIPAGTLVLDQRIFGSYVQELPAFDPEAVKPPEEPGVAAEVMAKLRQLRIGMTRAEVDKVLTLQDDHRDGAWTTYYAGTRTRILVAYDQRIGKDRPENEVLEIRVQHTPTPAPVSPPSQKHLQKLAAIRKLVRQVAVPGATRAEVERSFTEQDGGLQGGDRVRYYLGDQHKAGAFPDDNVKVEVQYDRTGGAGSPSNLVIEPPQVYFELHACN